MRAEPVDILILRRVKPEQAAAFQRALRAWVPASVEHPGHLGVFLVEPGPGTCEHGALLRFRTREDWEAFCNWPPYQRFLAEIRPMLEEEPRIEPLHGFEAFFRGAAPPPRWKMAVLTWIGVCGMVWLMSTGLGAVNGGWPRWVSFLATNALVVAGLAWVVMPALTSLAALWLKPPVSKREGAP
jgi:antibiotic biosynthesis monooxygenase (ABM) superfamily enzyme